MEFEERSMRMSPPDRVVRTLTALASVAYFGTIGNISARSRVTESAVIRPTPPATAYNPGTRRGIRIGSARTGAVQYFLPDPCPYPYPAASSLAEGVTVDGQGNMYGADFLMNVRKFVKK